MSTGRHRPSERRIPAAALAVGVAAAIVAAAVGILVLRDGASVLPGVDGGDEVPSFEFAVGRATAIPTTEGGRQRFRPQARAAARTAAHVLSDLYAAAFLDPANWRAGRYDSAWELFDGAAQEAARRDADVLTVGPSLGAGLERIEPRRGRLSVKVLVDEHGRPLTIVGIVRFSATAEGKDGTVRELVSAGQYFLRRIDGAWRVYSYDVVREDGAREAATATATPTGSEP
ncbi:MAG TPA: hypothetical protein VNO17_11790 [Actinomycetota bacterium]|nr:hypothetical protein [Actinomycetota bacterium]